MLMHPTQIPEIARHRQADMLCEAERARLAYLARHHADAPRRTFRFRLRRAPVAASLAQPALD